MTEAVFPTAYFGSIAYFQALVRFDSVLIEIHDHFPKQTFRNRCKIGNSQGALRLTLPVEKPFGSKTMTKDVLISHQQDWRTIHWRALQSAYASAPYFEHYSNEIKQLIDSKCSSLVDFNLQLTQQLLQFLGADVTINTTTDYQVSYPINDFREVGFDSDLLHGFTSIPYQQVYFTVSDFFSNRSILDLLFCEGPIGRKQLLL